MSMISKFAGVACCLVCAAATGFGADFAVQTATYIGGTSPNEEWNAVDIAPDGCVVVAGALPEGNPFGNVRLVDLLGGGYGVVARFAPGGTNAVSVSRLGDWIDDMETGEDGSIGVAGSFGVAVLSADGASVVWKDDAIIRGTKAAQFRNQTPPFKQERYTKRASRVAVGADGTVASIQSAEKVFGAGPKQGHLYVWDRTGKRLCDVPLVKYKYLEDVCVSASNKLVIVGGFNTYAADSKHMKDHPIHMPFIVAYSYDGTVKWEVYNFSAEASYAQNTFADSRVQRLTIGRDGFLYMGGYIHGGDYVWALDPLDVAKRSTHDTGYDSYSRAANMGRGIDQSYFAKFDPATGRILQGQVLLCRVNADGSGKPSQIQIKGIQADKKGNLYLSGYCEKFIKNRDACMIDGVAVGPYAKPEPFLLVVTPDFKTRKVWTVFAQHGEAAAWGVSVRNGEAVLLGGVYEGTVIATGNAFQQAPDAPIAGYPVVWKAE